MNNVNSHLAGHSPWSSEPDEFVQRKQGVAPSRSRGPWWIPRLPCLRPRSLYAYDPLGREYELTALDGAAVALSPFPLLYFIPRGRRWVAQPAPLARLPYLRWRLFSEGTEAPFQPLPATALSVHPGLEVIDARTGALLTIFPDRRPSPDFLSALTEQQKNLQRR